MSITDELRRYAANWDGWFYSEDGGLINALGYVPAQSTHVPKVINDIADRIDERHAKVRDKAYNEGVYDAIDADKTALGYIKRPVDADGVPWHLGDKVDGMVGEITYLTVGYIGWSFRLGDAYAFPCEKYHHAKPDSWEQIIKDAKNQADAAARGQTLIDSFRFTDEQLIERCRRLAHEDE